MVNNPSNKLKKGTAYHLDRVVVGVLNAGLTLFGLPWMHGVLPHSPLHARCLADLEERVEQGHVHEVVVRSRETRLTRILSHVLIGLSLLMLPYPLSYIPTAVLNGLFLYMAMALLVQRALKKTRSKMASHSKGMRCRPRPRYLTDDEIQAPLQESDADLSDSEDIESFDTIDDPD
ncbi:hypothetical protein V5799_006106 [Amblyomma americanum]|uniref:Bicarbonate transporter-like transmembrane domain-containing protein n=1 Tax=Amblyomma americanum TaxID=6943 RepID=A0AAQ4DXC3_AMBAM